MAKKKVVKEKKPLQSMEYCKKFAHADAKQEGLEGGPKIEFIKKRTKELFDIHGK